MGLVIKPPTSCFAFKCFTDLGSPAVVSGGRLLVYGGKIKNSPTAAKSDKRVNCYRRCVGFSIVKGIVIIILI